MRLLIEGGADPNATGRDQNSPLHSALHRPRQEDVHYMVEVLLYWQADPNAPEREGNTPLPCERHSPSMGNAHEVVKALLSWKADPFLKDHIGWNAIDLAHTSKLRLSQNNCYQEEDYRQIKKLLNV
jgi:ankyrin repeat protein